MIKIDAATLLQMINRVKKFASTDNEFILNTVHIHALNGYLWAEATDRYKAAGVKGPACGEEFNTAIYLRDIQRIAYLLRWFKGGTVELSTRPITDKDGKLNKGEHIVHVSVRYDKTGAEVDFIARTDYPPIHKLPEIEKGMNPTPMDRPTISVTSPPLQGSLNKDSSSLKAKRRDFLWLKTAGQYSCPPGPRVVKRILYGTTSSRN
jgi:hypothetical protein